MRAIPYISICRSVLAFLWLFASTLMLHIENHNAVAIQDIETKAYIVYLGERKHKDVEVITSSHHEMLASVLGSKEAARDAMIYSYRHGFSGFAAKMTDSHAQTIADLPGVVHVLPNRLYKMHTTRSWDYLGLSPHSTSNLLHDTNQGDGAIVGVIDSGIWPESKSLSDKGLGPIPSRWKGFCQSGQRFNASKHCNNKLIGARFFIDGFLASYGGPFNASKYGEFLSPRDSSGHGTHCASIASGSFVPNVSYNGLAPGWARGGAPKSRLAIYKVGWLDTGSSVDVLKAFDEAIHDGVDVLSVSWGSYLPLFPEIDRRDIIYYGSFHAVSHGITVVCSGGNSGPNSQTVEDVAPWVISVAASTIDRSFPTPIMLGNNQTFVGEAMYVGNETGFVGLIHGEPSDVLDAKYCESITKNDTWVAGKVVLCFTSQGEGGSIFQAKQNVLKAGGLGVIAAQNDLQELSIYYDAFPCIFVTYDVGTQILNYIRSTRFPKARLKPSKTYSGKQVSTYVASFSSRGPNSLSPSVLKPDIAAPGVDVLAARRKGYAFNSGTSMAAPHVAGTAALLKSLHLSWSPAAVRSALVTTAWTMDPHSGEPVFAKGGTPKVADPFDYGGGVVNPNGARNPGLVYDMGPDDYISYLCAMGYNETSIDGISGRAGSCGSTSHAALDLNLPSITVPNLKESVTLTRTVANVGNPNSKYEALVTAPRGVLVEVNPMKLLFSPQVKKMSFTVTISTLHKVTTEYYFGSLTWADGVHRVSIPISVKTEFPRVYG